MENLLSVSEIFLSLQGEGRLAGVVSVFVRLAGCDLRCRWCDTAYALRREQGCEMTVGQVIEQVKKFGCEQVVVTGGEPMLAEGLEELLGELKGLDCFVTLETNGRRFRRLKCDLVSISPKLDNAQAGEAGVNIAAIQSFVDNYDYQLKFVVEQEADLEQVEQVLGQLKGVERGRVMLMPQARTKAEYHKRSGEVARMCVENGFRFSPRLQVELWGSRRGR